MPRRPPRPTYQGARSEELAEPLLPRWFVLLAVLAVPVAIGVAIWSFLAFGPQEVPVAARRPPPEPASPLTTAVGDLHVGTLDAVALDAACPVVEGIQAGGTAVDRARIQTAVDAICEITLPGEVGQRLAAFARGGGVVRFAQFEATGVDSTLDTSTDPPRVLINARLAREGTDPRWIAPLIVHDTTYLDEPAGTVDAALTARRAEAEVCARMFVEDRPSRACDDAAALLALPDPAGALADAGFTAD